MTKKQKYLHQYFLPFMLLLFGIIIVSCEAEENFIENNIQNNNEDLSISIMTINYQDAGEEFDRISSKHQLDRHIALESHDGIQKRESSSGGIVIISDIVKEIKQGDYTSYTMLVESIDATSNIFYNLTIEIKDGISKMFITKYSPTAEWLANRKIAFQGEITTFRINDLQTPIDQIDTPASGIESGGGNTTYPTDCDGLVVSTTIINEIPCGCHHSWQQLLTGVCTGCTDNLPTFPSLTTTTVYECVPLSTPIDGDPASGSPGGGSSSGSTTSPAGNNSSLTSPIDPKDSAINVSNPCGALAKIAASYNYAQSINYLKEKAAGPKEHAWVYKYHPETTTFAAPTVAGHNTESPNKVNLYAFIGNDWIGAFHNHTTGDKPTIKMFSGGDLEWFFIKASRRNNFQPPSVSSQGINELFLGLVNVNEVYCLKIKNWYKFYLLKDKLKKINEDLELLYTESGANASQTQLQKDFLKILKQYDLGIGLYEQNEDGDWSEINLDPANPNNNPVKTPCN